MKDIAKFIADAEAAIANIKAAVAGYEGGKSPVDMDERDYKRWSQKQSKKGAE
jgi:TPP-dependent trihydroxycyclohexane-1,2-dione (THcHDO) dehydratase